MLSLPEGWRYFLYQPPCDMRKSFDGLQGIVQNQFQEKLESGKVFIFLNKRRDRLKLLHFDGEGFCLFYKRLEAGRFQLPATNTGMIPRRTLLLILEGIELKKVGYRKRYGPKNP